MEIDMTSVGNFFRVVIGLIVVVLINFAALVVTYSILKKILIDPWFGESNFIGQSTSSIQRLFRGILKAFSLIFKTIYNCFKYIILAIYYIGYAIHFCTLGAFTKSYRSIKRNLGVFSDIPCKYCKNREPCMQKNNCRKCSATYAGMVYDPCPICKSPPPDFLICSNCNYAVDIRWLIKKSKESSR